LDFYPFRFDVKRLRPLLQRDLYTNADIAIRELAQNAHDAILRRAKMEKTFVPERDGEIVFQVNSVHGTLSVTDNGAGMSKEKILNVFRYYGRTDKEANDEVGTFGLGAKSIFARADSFTINTRSMETGETSQVYARLEGLAFQPSPPARESPGTTITLPSQMKLEPLRQALDKYCRAVRIPIYVEQIGEDGKHLVSQQSPWHGKCVRIQGDGLDVYVVVSSHDDNGAYVGMEGAYGGRLCVEGFTVTDKQLDIGLEGVAVNLTRKDVANLTMGREDFIKDEKYKRLPETVIDTIAMYVTKMNFDSLQVLESQAKFIEWLGSHSEGWRLWEKIPNKARTTIRTLTDKIAACPSLEESWRTKDIYKTTLLKVLFEKKKKYFLFGKPRQVVEKLAKDADAIIIYHGCGQNRATLKTHLTKYGVQPFGEDDTESDRYAMYAPDGIDYFSTLTELEAAYKPSERGLFFIVPSQTHSRELQQNTRRLGIHAVKLKPHETIDGSWIDLRSIPGKDVIFNGKSVACSVDLSSCKNTTIAPPEFFKFAQAAKDEPVIFPQDMISLCALLIRGARLTNIERMRAILKAALPEEVYRRLYWWRLRDIADYRAVASLAATLDWRTNPYSAWLFTLAVNSDSLHAVSTNPNWATAEEIHIEKTEIICRQ